MLDIERRKMKELDDAEFERLQGLLKTLGKTYRALISEVDRQRSDNPYVNPQAHAQGLVNLSNHINKLLS